MIASAAITTAMMMMIPMLMAAIIRPPLATISPRLPVRNPDKQLGWSCSRALLATSRLGMRS
jgi:hypothetical protein